MVQINWTIQSQEDLKNIYDYISKDSKQYAKLQVIRLRNRVSILQNYSLAGRIVPEINKDNFRELVEGSYRIIYKIISENQVDILTVHHSARDLGNRKI